MEDILPIAYRLYSRPIFLYGVLLMLILSLKCPSSLDGVLLILALSLKCPSSLDAVLLIPELSMKCPSSLVGVLLILVLILKCRFSLEGVLLILLLSLKCLKNITFQHKVISLKNYSKCLINKLIIYTELFATEGNNEFRGKLIVLTHLLHRFVALQISCC